MLFRLILSTALLLLSNVSWAAKPDELRYNYVDISLTSGTAESDDNFDEDLDFGAFVVQGSVEVAPYLALIGGIGAVAFDDVYNSTSTSLTLGVQPHFPIAKNVDIFIPVAFINQEIDCDICIAEDDTGYSVGVGIRALLNPSLELSGGFQYLDTFDVADKAIAAELRWHITGLFSLAWRFNAIDFDGGDAVSGTFGARFTF